MRLLILLVFVTISYAMPTFASKISWKSLVDECKSDDMDSCNELINYCELQDLFDKNNLLLVQKSCFSMINEDLFYYDSEKISIAYNNLARAELFGAKQHQVQKKVKENGVRKWVKIDDYYVTDDRYTEEALRLFNKASRFSNYTNDYASETERKKLRQSEIWYSNREYLVETMTRNLASRPGQTVLSEIKVMNFSRPVRMVTKEELQQKRDCFSLKIDRILSGCNSLIQNQAFDDNVLDAARTKLAAAETLNQKVTAGSETDGYLAELALLDFSALSSTRTKAIKALYIGDNEGVTTAFGGDKVAAARFLANYAVIYPTVCITRVSSIYVKMGDTVRTGVFVSGPLKGIPDPSTVFRSPGLSFSLPVLSGFEDIVGDMRVFGAFGTADFERFIKKSNLCHGKFSERLHRNMRNYYDAL